VICVLGMLFAKSCAAVVPMFPQPRMRVFIWTCFDRS
jgi:hypothetical protein